MFLSNIKLITFIEKQKLYQISITVINNLNSVRFLVLVKRCDDHITELSFMVSDICIFQVVLLPSGIFSSGTAIACNSIYHTFIADVS